YADGNCCPSLYRQLFRRWTATLVIIALLGACRENPPSLPMNSPPPTADWRHTLPEDTPIAIDHWRYVDDFPKAIAQFDTVFWEPRDTESLRALIRDTDLVRDKAVMEIGTGTGLVALCCLQHGARKVIATDVNPAAIANAHYNAERLGLGERLDVRWVDPALPDAYSALRPDEVFDLIISNPPWEDQHPNSIADFAFYDENFALLASIVAGIPRRLDKHGSIFLAYGCRSAIERVHQLAQQRSLIVQVLDNRDLPDLPEVFLPGMLLQLQGLQTERESAIAD
ncbi:MAG: class I SAM-dependent methyltransferase, partial [Planctomycetales bacterium]|nr:class I SAM-dependent methyltransferase [Planctomycetales bacterium]